MTKPPNFIFLGLSGSGKGTQEELLKEALEPQFKMRIISTGGLYRQLFELDTAVGRRVRDIVNKGNLAPSEFTVMLWMHEATFNVMEDEGIIFDGTPRRVPEALNLDQFLEFVDRRSTTQVIYLHVSPEEVTRRLLERKRGDDTPDSIRKRIDYFYSEVMETIEYYRNSHRVVEINGEQSVEKVHQDIMNAIKV